MRARFCGPLGSAHALANSLALALALAPLAPVLAGTNETAPTTLQMGDDSSAWAEDGECDDVRFAGMGMASILLTDSIGKDAADCGAALAAGTISVDPMHAEPANDEAILYGDDKSAFANNGECDDIRFVSQNSAKMVYIAEDIGHDASDCRAAFEAGEVTWQGSSANPELGVTAGQILNQIDAEKAQIV